MKLINLQCPNCGAKLSDISTDSILECPFCNSKFKIEVEIKPQIPENMQDVGYEFEKGRLRAQKDSKGNHKKIIALIAGRTKSCFNQKRDFSERRRSPYNKG